MIEKLNIDNILQYMILANTPYYLIKHCLLDDDIIFVSRKYSTNDIINKIKELVDNDNKSIEDIAAFYGLITALRQKDDIQAEQFLSEMGNIQIKWVEYFRDHFLSSRRSETILLKENNYRLNIDSIKINTQSSQSFTENKIPTKIELIEE